MIRFAEYALGGAAFVFVAAWVAFVDTYNDIRNAQRPEIRDRMPTGNQAWWAFARRGFRERKGAK